MTSKIIRDSPATSRGAALGGKANYYLPVKVCATCGQTTRGSFHERCKRVEGQLVVVEKKP